MSSALDKSIHNLLLNTNNFEQAAQKVLNLLTTVEMNFGLFSRSRKPPTLQQGEMFLEQLRDNERRFSEMLDSMRENQPKT